MLGIGFSHSAFNHFLEKIKGLLIFRAYLESLEAEIKFN